MATSNWAPLGFQENASAYNSGSQTARIWTEAWMRDWGYCPRCGAASLSMAANNAKAKDFSCKVCAEDYELKSSKSPFGKKIVNGAFDSLTKRMISAENPSLLMMRYDIDTKEVRDLIGVPKQFFVPAIIEKRKTLGPTARRAGWVGCNILISNVPEIGRVPIILDGKHQSKQSVVDRWNAAHFLRDKALSSRSWLLAILECLDKLGQQEFALVDVYDFEAELKKQFPGNNNVRPKIRQQLQFLRDGGVISFLGGGKYRRLDQKRS
jgi:Dam-replacing family/Dam-replacing HTH domain